VSDNPNTQIVPVDGDNPESIVESAMPTRLGSLHYPEDSRKGKYLSYRACGFTIRESIRLVNVSERTLRRWRDADPEFAKIDLEGMGELRAKLGDHYIELEFRRNFRLILGQDYEIFNKAVEGQPLTDKEHAYLLKARGHYTPQQLETIERLIGEGGDEGFDFTKFVLSLHGERGDLEITGEKRR